MLSSTQRLMTLSYGVGPNQPTSNASRVTFRITFNVLLYAYCTTHNDRNIPTIYEVKKSKFLKFHSSFFSQHNPLPNPFLIKIQKKEIKKFHPLIQLIHIFYQVPSPKAIFFLPAVAQKSSPGNSVL